MSGEYNGNIVGSSTCSYSNLCNYNGGPAMGKPMDKVPCMAQQIIPLWTYPPPYDTLSHGNKGGQCGGFFNLKAAYPCTPKDKNPFVKRPCTTSPAQGKGCWSAATACKKQL